MRSTASIAGEQLPQTLGRLDEIYLELDRPCGGAVGGLIDPTLGSIFAVGRSTYSRGTISPLGNTLNVRGNVFYSVAASGSGVPVSPSAGGGGALPIVFIAHGNHDPALPSFEGYHYLQETLAGFGIISVSVDCNDTNGVSGDATNILERALLIVEAIRVLRRLNTAGSGSIFEGRVDLANVGLLGHSRGGEAIFPAALLSAGEATIRAMLTLAPTRRAVNPTAAVGVPLVPAAPPGVPLMVVLPAADDDVRNNEGAGYYDRSEAPKYQLYIQQMVHNFFNTTWVKGE